MDCCSSFEQISAPITMLCGKHNPKSNQQFKKAYVQLTKSHTNCIMESNCKALLLLTTYLPAGKDFFISGNGRLIKQGSSEAATGAARTAGAVGDTHNFLLAFSLFSFGFAVVSYYFNSIICFGLSKHALKCCI